MKEPQTATDSLIWGILDQSPSLVKKALLDGANADLPWDKSNSTPIWAFALRYHDWNIENLVTHNQVLDLVVPASRNVTGPEPYNGYPLFHAAFNIQNTEVASLVLLAAIRETKGNIRIDLPLIFEGIGDEPYSTARKETQETILAAHKRVGERLKNPVTAIEKEAAACLTKIEDKTYWQTPLAFPDLADLPVPNHQFIAAVHQIGAAVSEAGTLIRPFVSRDGMLPIPGHVRAGARAALEEAREVSGEIDGMRSRGLIGIRKPRPRQGTNDKT